MKVIDSLRQLLDRPSDTQQFEVLWTLSRELVAVNKSEALFFAKKSRAVSLIYGDSLDIVKAGRLLGQIYRRVNELDSAIAMLAGVLPISKRHDFRAETKFILNSLAIAHAYKAEYDKALEYHFQSLVIREAEGDKKEISITLNNIGFVFYKLGNIDLALDYYLQSLKAKEDVGDTYDLDRLLINIGLCYSDLNDHINAQKYFQRAFEVCGGSCDNEIVIEGEFGLGNSLFEQREFKAAELHHKKSLELSTKEGNVRFQLENLISLTKIYLNFNQIALANDYRRKAVMLASKNSFKELMLKVYQLNADFFIASNDYKQANLYQRRYSKLKDSIFDADVIRNLTRVQTQYAQRENLAIIAAKDQVLSLQEEVITQQRTLNWLLAAVIVSTATLGYVIFRNYQRIKAVNSQLGVAKQVIEDQNRFLDHQVQEKTKELVDSNEALIKVNDELDNFIYKTSHDIRGPLASLKGMVNLAIMDVKDDKALNYLGKLDLTAEKLNMILTRLLIVNRINHTELKPEIIHFEPIIQEILTLEMKKGVPAKISIEYDVAHDANLVSDREMVKLILENLIDNALKFYNESERIDSFVKINVKSTDGKVTVHVLDNGVGIAETNREKIFQMFVRASERSDTGGIGLYLAKLATEKLGGEISLTTSQERVTEFVVEFPASLQDIIDRRNVEKRRQEDERLQLATQATRKSLAVEEKEKSNRG